MKTVTCIVCPIGCTLTVTEQEQGSLQITGNRCPRGANYAREEIQSPRRTVTATCALHYPDSSNELPEIQRLPVKTSVPCPKDKISALLQDIYAMTVTPPIQRGTVLLHDWQNTGIDVIAVRSIQ